MTIEEARSILKQNAKLAVEIYRRYTRVGFDYESPIALAYDVRFALARPVVPPPDDECWDIPF